MMPDKQLLATIGILCGLGAAFFQAWSYFFSRRFLTECRSSSRALFSIAHVQMGIFALIGLPFLLQGPLPPFSELWWPLLATSGFYLTAQWLLFTILKRTDSSVVAPLLGLKIPALGIISVLVLNEPLPAAAWTAIILCTLAAFLVSPPKGLPELGALSLILVTCLLYCGSDLHIPRLVAKVQEASPLPTLLGVSLTYMVCGAVGLVVALHQRAFQIRGAQKYALPYSTAWFLGMCCLFAAFSFVGVIFGNMLQSMRGFLSVVIGVAISLVGWHHLEARLTIRHWTIRCVGALLMTIAIVLYYSTKL
ncbi:MAG: DMT family transporter [Candidatus Pacebacteria bacterium]|nr:DMT family transporter [Candidatus Paceibacterota bacterium]